VVFLGGLTASSSDVTSTTRAALQAAESEAGLAKLEGLLELRADQYLASSEVTSLSQTRQSVLERELRRTDTGEPVPGTARPPLLLSMNETIALQQAAGLLSVESDRFIDEGSSAAAQASRTALANYYDEPSPGNLRLLVVHLEGLLQATALRAQSLATESEVREAGQASDTSTAARAVLVALTVTGLIIVTLSQRITHMVRLSIETGRSERLELEIATTRLQFRNDQLNALYNVFTEIADTLSLEYVVHATLRESMSIMRADMATVRILRGNELVPVGAMNSEGQEIKHLASTKLGVGPTGRTAKRGRTLRIDEGGERMMVGLPGTIPGESPAQQTNRAPMESGLIVPLVVGARVVGTLACWSARKNAFGDEDQRVLEMMASQVATAVAAVDATESSERRAHQDPLTSLPNRRQLDEDLAGPLSLVALQGRSAVVAMLDIDFFKRLNDEYGHQIGDVALRRIAAALRSSVRDNDHVYRFGGEEFVVVFKETTVAEAMPLAERLRTAVMRVEVIDENDRRLKPVTVSIGLAVLPEHGDEVRLLIDLADKAMYRAKAAGRNRIEVWSDDGETEPRTEAA
jgi:diguanylate cyclase (GGDEF)-like protein